MSGVEAIGLDRVIVNFEAMGDRQRAAIERVVVEETIELERIVKEEKLSGQVLNARTGRLRDSIHHEFTGAADSFTGVVGTDVKYAKPLEYGAAPHVIEPVTARALSFVVGGRRVFAKRVNHPGNRAYRYLSGTLEERAGVIRARLHEAVGLDQ